MSNDASCSFCSHVDDSIHVICEGRCLICSHCQRSTGIRQLLINMLDKKPGTEPACPLCSHALAPNMITNIKKMRKDLTNRSFINARDALVDTRINFPQVVPPTGRKSYRSAVKTSASTVRGINGNPDGKRGLESSYLEDNSDDIPTNFITDDSVSVELQEPPIPLQQQQRQRSFTGSGSRGSQGKRGSIATPVATNPAQLPVSAGYTAVTALDLIVDVYAKMWDNYLSGRHDAILEVIRDIHARNKISRSLIEARVKLMVDFFSSQSADQTYDDPLGLTTVAESRRVLKDAVGNSSSGSVPPISRPNSAGKNGRSDLMKANDSPLNSSRPRTQDSTRPLPLTRSFRPPVLSQVLADYNVANTHLFLFGKLLGVQPRLVETVKPAQAYIVVMLMVVALCDKCLKWGSLVCDVSGRGVREPSKKEFVSRLTSSTASTKQSLTGKKISSVSLKRAILMVKCLIDCDEERFNMIPLSSACMEYGVELPWSASSVAALLHLIYSPNEGASKLLSLNAVMKAELKLAEDLAAAMSPSTAADKPGATGTPGDGKTPKMVRSGTRKDLLDTSQSPVTGYQSLPPSEIFPPVNELRDVVRRHWSMKEKLQPLDFASALKQCKNAQICLPYLVLMLAEAWEAECEYIQQKIKASKYANSRRHGLMPNTKPFTKASASLTIADKKTLKYIYEKYADKELSSYELGSLPDDFYGSDTDSVASSVDTAGENSVDTAVLFKKRRTGSKLMSSTGIDWDVVKADAVLKNIVPYLENRPDFITKKSNAELEHLTKLTILQIRKRQEWDKLLSDSGWKDDWMWGGMYLRPPDHKKDCKVAVGQKGDNLSVAGLSLADYHMSSVLDELANYAVVEMPKHIEPYQMAILRRMNTMGDNDLFQNRLALRGRPTKNTISRLGSSGEWAEFPEADAKTLALDRLGSLHIPDVSEGTDKELMEENREIATQVTHKAMERRLSRVNSAELRETVSQESKLKRRPSSLGDFLHSGKYLSRGGTRSCPPSRMQSMSCPEIFEEDLGGTNLPNISKKDMLGSRFGLSTTMRAPSPKSQTRYILQTNASMPTLTVKPELVPYRIAKSPLTPVSTLLTTQKTLSQTSPWLSPNIVRHPVHLTDILNKKVGSEVLVRAGVLRPNTADEKKFSTTGSVISEGYSESSAFTWTPEDESGSDCDMSSMGSKSGNCEDARFAVNFLVPPEELKRRLASAPIGHERNIDDEECMIFRTVSPSGVQNRRTVDLGHYGKLRLSEIPSTNETNEIESLILTEVLLDASCLRNVLNKFTLNGSCPLTTLRKLDLTGNKIGDEGVRVLSDALSAACGAIVDISLKRNGITDIGAIELFVAICDGGGHESIRKVDLSENCIALMNPKFSQTISLLTALKLLDLSWNSITVVHLAQKTNIKETLKSLQSLEIFSMAYNRIGDTGLELCLTECQTHNGLKVLDLAYCFTTRKVIPSILKFVTDDSKEVEVLMLQGISVVPRAATEIEAAADAHNMQVLLEGHHTGISIPLRYTSPAENSRPIASTS